MHLSLINIINLLHLSGAWDLFPGPLPSTSPKAPLNSLCLPGSCTDGVCSQQAQSPWWERPTGDFLSQQKGLLEAESSIRGGGDGGQDKVRRGFFVSAVVVRPVLPRHPTCLPQPSPLHHLALGSLGPLLTEASGRKEQASGVVLGKPACLLLLSPLPQAP